MMVKPRRCCDRHVRSRRMEPGRTRGVWDMHVGLTMFPTDYAIPPHDLAVAAEARGYDSLWLPEHSHIPTSRKSPWPDRDDYWITAVNAGFRTGLAVPLLKDNKIVGIITLGRKQVQPFTAKPPIPLESPRLERQYREAQMALAHANRVATMGQLTASITHEVNQPITAAVTYALAARRFLSADPPNFREADDALSLIVKEGNRAGEGVERVRALVLPRVQGDRVQLQQVMLNLIVNAIQSMRDVEDGNRELHISTVSIEPEGVRVAVRDTGHGLRPESLPRLFES